MPKAPEQTLWPTMVKKRVGDVFVGLDNSAWVYRIIPMSPVADAKTDREKLEAGEPIRVSVDEVADITPPRGKSRGVSKSGYRHVHIELVEFPTTYRPPEKSPIGSYLKAQYPDQTVYRRLLVMGVKLNPIDIGLTAFKKGGLSRAIESVSQTLSEGGTPLSDFDEDHAKVSRALDRAGLVPLTKRDQRDLEAYWNSGGHPDVPYLAHANHIHFMDSADSMSVAERVGLDHCEDWGELQGHRILTFASVDDFDFGYTDATNNVVQWATQMVNSGASVISIRGMLEKPEITAAMLRHQKAEYLKDLNTQRAAGKMSRADIEKKMGELDSVEAYYKGGGAPVTFVDTSIIVGFNGRVSDIEQVVPANTSLNEMSYRQVGAWSETMLCSGFRANPNLQDLPSNMIAYSGLPSLNIVGDPDGALVGFTEKDAQPSYLSPVAASKEDSSPITLVAAGTGTGKSVLMLYMADQFARLGSPVVIIDPKTGSDHSAAVKLSGGQVARLDEITQSDGILDPIRFSQSKDVGISLAASVLSSIDPWGGRARLYEIDLLNALRYGVENGANCSGQAIRIAYEAGVAAKELVEPLFKARNSPMFSAIFGVDPNGKALSISDGITLIMVGSGQIPLPAPGTDIHDASFEERVGLAMVRMMVFGSSMALTGRGGVIMLDEAHVFLNSNPREIQLLGRVARSQQVLPMLFTQETTDALKAGLKPYISRGFIGPVKSEEQAKAAFELFGLEATPDRVERLLAKPTLKGTSAPNWSSMRALYERNPDGSRRNVRGTIFLYSDLNENTLPIEAKLPPRFLFLASTNPDDIARREAELAMKEGRSVQRAS